MRELDFLPPHYKRAHRQRPSFWLRAIGVALLSIGVAGWLTAGRIKLPPMRSNATPNLPRAQRPAATPDRPQQPPALQDDTTATIHSSSGQ